MKDPETMKPKLSLYKLTEELLETSEKLVGVWTAIIPLEIEYRKVKGKLQLTSKRGAYQDRFTEADVLVIDDPIEEKYQTKRAELKALSIHFEALKLAVKSLQSLSYSGGGDF